MSAKLVASLAMLLLVSGGIALAQEVEPDDVVRGAMDVGTIGVEGELISHHASLGYPGEIDWFKFSVEAQTVDLVVSTSPPEDFRLVIYDDNLSYIDSSSEGLQIMTLWAGTYFVRVDSIDLKVANYSITISSLFEAEPNDCVSGGNDLGVLADTTTVGGTIDPAADTDFFLFEVDPESEGYAMISAVATADLVDGGEDDEDLLDFFDYLGDISLVLYRYDEEEDRYLPIDYGDYGIEADLSAGRYAVRAESASLDPIAGYVLIIAFSNFECEDEPNDSSEEALDMGVLTAGADLAKTGCILPGDDVDYYVLAVEEALEVAIETKGDSDGDSCLYLYDKEMEEINYDDDGGEGSWSRIEELLDPGTYFIKVESFWGSAFQYTLTVTGAEAEE